MGFKIFLKCQRFVLVWKGAVPNQLPRSEFRGVAGFAGIMFWQPPFKSAVAPMYSCLGKLMLRMM
jgi:hypothetical protein